MLSLLILRLCMHTNAAFHRCAVVNMTNDGSCWMNPDPASHVGQHMISAVNATEAAVRCCASCGNNSSCKHWDIHHSDNANSSHFQCSLRTADVRKSRPNSSCPFSDALFPAPAPAPHPPPSPAPAPHPPPNPIPPHTCGKVLSDTAFPHATSMPSSIRGNFTGKV